MAESYEISALAGRWIRQAHEIVLNSSSEELNQSDLPRLVESDPETAWLVIKAIVRSLDGGHASSISAHAMDRIVGLLGAGDLEDLLQAHYQMLIDRVISEIISSKVLRQALKSTWQGDIPEETWDRLQGALA